MRKFTFALAGLCLCGIVQMKADSLTESAQRVLKDQGFYYGEPTGRKDADTTAAIRRYQIRNGLKITGEINPETMKALGLKGSLPPPRATPATPQSRPSATSPPRENLRPENSEYRDEEPVDRSLSPPVPPGYPMRQVFSGTPYEFAEPDLQREIILGAQSFLTRFGYYRSEIDGIYGPGMVAAVRAYQQRYGMAANGRLDTETLAVLRLLPRQRAPGLTSPRRRILPPSGRFTPDGEPIYTPR